MGLSNLLALAGIALLATGLVVGSRRSHRLAGILLLAAVAAVTAAVRIAWVRAVPRGADWAPRAMLLLLASGPLLFAVGHFVLLPTRIMHAVFRLSTLGTWAFIATFGILVLGWKPGRSPMLLLPFLLPPALMVVVTILRATDPRSTGVDAKLHAGIGLAVLALVLFGTFVVERTC